MGKNIMLKRLNFNEETQIIDVIYHDVDLQQTFGSDKNIRSRLLNSCYAALIKKDEKTIGFIMIVNNTRTNVNEVDIGILKGYRNKGYGTAALSILKNIIINNELEVEIHAKKQNINAIKSIEKNNFVLLKKDQHYNYYTLPKTKRKI